MRNPVRSETEAFQAVLWLLAVGAAIALAAGYGGMLAGLGVLAFLLVLGLGWWMRSGAGEAPAATSMPPAVPGERRILVVANETLEGSAVLDAVREAAGSARARVHVVCPALNSRLRHWTSDEDDAVAEAEGRLARSLARLQTAGMEATGEVGDGDPLQAIEDALRTRGAEALVISTHPPGRSNWLEGGVVGRAASRFGLPVTHVVVDLEAGGMAA